jgi:hypothetical protein
VPSGFREATAAAPTVVDCRSASRPTRFYPFLGSGSQRGSADFGERCRLTVDTVAFVEFLL